MVRERIAALRGESAEADAGATAASEAPLAELDAGAVPPVEPTAPSAASRAALNAKNVDDIARFPGEKPLNDAQADVTRTANVHELPGAGDVIAVLTKGTKVVQVSAHDAHVLVTFANPASAGETLAGWIAQAAFAADEGKPSPAKAPAPKCKAGEVALFGETSFCATACDRDEKCPTGKTCTGVAPSLKNGAAGPSVKYCVAHAVPKAPAATPDAGAGTASQPATGGADAGTTTAAGTPQLPAVNLPDAGITVGGALEGLRTLPGLGRALLDGGGTAP
jgi:hypothetical protein